MRPYLVNGSYFPSLCSYSIFWRYKKKWTNIISHKGVTMGSIGEIIIRIVIIICRGKKLN
jgi:hypothetical protein